jgi:pyruvate/2-oxoglutarate dehydrogenase complex dihydrolipoamide dehydrogenase (E3) component
VTAESEETNVSDRYDAIVIGAGPAGEVCAGELADGGMRVAIVERELVAGECSYWACIPSKTLLRPGEAISAARQAPGAREAIRGGLDTGQALAWRNFKVADWDDSGQSAGWTVRGSSCYVEARVSTGRAASWSATGRTRPSGSSSPPDRSR